MSVAIRPRRSVLYMPGSNARALEKARGLSADALILDLEDAVAPDAKIAARAQVATAVKAKSFGPREVVVRINGLDTPWAKDDLAAIIAAEPDAILVPKVSSAEDLKSVGAPPKISIWAMIETSRAILNAGNIAAASRGPSVALKVFVLGTNDLAKETRAQIVPGRLPMLSFFSTVILAARAHGLDVIDGVYNDLDDMQGFARECAEARDLGFDGKTLIHPKQIEPCNAAFTPSPAEVTDAKKIVAAFDQPENRDKGVIALDGRMVERLHAESARRTVALAEAAAAREQA